MFLQDTMPECVHMCEAMIKKELIQQAKLWGQ